MAKEFEAFQLEKGEPFPGFDSHGNFAAHLCSIECLGLAGNFISMEDSLEEKEPEVEVSSNVPKEVEGIKEHTVVGTSPRHSSRYQDIQVGIEAQIKITLPKECHRKEHIVLLKVLMGLREGETVKNLHMVFLSTRTMHYVPPRKGKVELI